MSARRNLTLAVLAAATLVPVATAGPAAAAAPSATCVNGWVAPVPGSAEYTEALNLITGQMGVSGDLVVDEMRYFTGPEVWWIAASPDAVVERWYVRASLADDPAFRGRWLLEARSATVRGISAVAPYDTTGYQSPDWRGFVGEGPPQTIAGLPGQWGGIEYDFVTGEGDSGNPGLPDEVVGCMPGGLPVTA